MPRSKPGPQRRRSRADMTTTTREMSGAEIVDLCRAQVFECPRKSGRSIHGRARGSIWTQEGTLYRLNSHECLNIVRRRARRPRVADQAAALAYANPFWDRAREKLAQGRRMRPGDIDVFSSRTAARSHGTHQDAAAFPGVTRSWRGTGRTTAAPTARWR